MLLTTLLFTMKTPVYQEHEFRFLGVFRWIGLVAILLSMTLILVTDVFSYSSISSGAVTKEVGVVPFRAMATQEELANARYCHWVNPGSNFSSKGTTSSSAASSTSSPMPDSTHYLVQESFPRLCTRNITCNKWLDDAELFKADHGSLFITSFVQSDPDPIQPRRYLKDFNQTLLAPLLSTEYRSANQSTRAAIERSIFGDNYDFKCDESYFVVRPEEVKVSVFHAVAPSAKRYAPIIAPRTIVYNHAKQKIGEFKQGTEPEFTLHDLFPFENFDELVPVPMTEEATAAFREDKNGGSESNNQMLMVPFRLIGGKAAVIFKYTNELDGKILDHIVCIVTVEVFGVPFAPSQNRMTKLRDYETNEYTVGRFTHYGVNLRVIDKVEVLSNDYYNIFMHYISVAVLMQEFNALMMLLTIVLVKCGGDSKSSEETDESTTDAGDGGDIELSSGVNARDQSTLPVMTQDEGEEDSCFVHIGGSGDHIANTVHDNKEEKDAKDDATLPGDDSLELVELVGPSPGTNAACVGEAVLRVECAPHNE